MWRKYDNLFERGKMSSKQLLSAVLARLPGLLGPDRDLKFYRHGWCGGGGGGMGGRQKNPLRPLGCSVPALSRRLILVLAAPLSLCVN